VLTQPLNPRTEVLLKLLNVPVIAEVEGGFRWAAPGDVVLLDADHGFVIINPSRAEVAALRAWRRDHHLAVDMDEPPRSEDDYT